jgi:REP element-mobilizing transposase RayT
MANTYTQLYVQIIFAVQGRLNLIHEKSRNELEKYMCGIVSNNKSKALALYCNPDHVHFLIGLHPTMSVSDMAREIKANSTSFINDKKWIMGKFCWQDGFSAFTYSKSQIDVVSKYILNQPQHHKKRTFREEYLDLLKKWEMQFDDRYVFEFYD